MDKIHNKASKIFDDVCKKKSKLSKTKDSIKISSDHIADVPYKCCIYCQKVFINSKFLMKHLLRRHSDELILFYKNYTDHEFKNTSIDLQHLISILKAEFSSLKQELVSVKLLDEKNETEHQATEGEEIIHAVKKHQTNNGDIVSNEIKDLKEKIVDVEKDIQNLNDKFIELDDVLKNEVLMKQDASEKLLLSETKILQAQESQFVELRQILLNELRSLLHNQQQEINSEWKSQLFELRHEIKKLDFAINNVKQQLLHTDSLKEEIKKELVPHIIPYITSKRCKKKKIKHSLSKNELSIDGSYGRSDQQTMLSNDNCSCKKSKSKSIRNQSEATFETSCDLVSAVADKLAQFAITPNTSKISYSQFNNTLKLLSIEKQQFSEKYSNFDEIYNKLNMIANQKARNKLKNKRHHKIRFAEPLTSSRCSSLNHSPVKNSIHEPSPPIQNRNKQFNCTKNLMPSDTKYVSQKKTYPVCEKTSKTFSDKGASGDSVLSFPTKQSIPVKQTTKLSSIEEFETSDSIEDIPNKKDLTVTFSKDNMTIIAEKSKYKKQPKSKIPIEYESEFFMNSYSAQLKNNAGFTLPEKNDNNDSFPLSSNKQNMPMKHAELTYVKRYDTSNPIEDIQNSERINAIFSKGSISVTTENCKRQSNCVPPIEHSKFDSAKGSHSVQLEKPLSFDKFSELEDYCKSEDDLNDVSSLEAYKSSSDDDDHHIVTRS